MENCNKCDGKLVIGDNWLESSKKNQIYTCKSCWSNRAKSYYKKKKEHIIQKSYELYHNKYKYNSEKQFQYRDRNKKQYIKTSYGIALDKVFKGNKGGDWVYYELKFTHIQLGFSFYKFGITQHSIEHRYKKYPKYEYEIKKEVYGDKSYIKGLEAKTKADTINNQFIFPEKIKFSGFSECRKYL